MGHNKHNFGKRFSEFLSKIFWHFDPQAAPSYSFINRNRSTSSSSSNKDKLNVHCQKSSMNRDHIRNQYPARYRTCSMRQRTTKLTLIEEE